MSLGQSIVIYNVEYPDETSAKIIAGIIDDNMISQVDSKGCNYYILAEVCDKSSGRIAIKCKDGFT